MSTHTAQIKKPNVAQVFLQACVILMLLTGFFGFTWGRIAGLSFALGGALAILAQAYFSWRVYRHTGAKHAKQVMNGFYKGETAKFLIVGIGFALLFKVNPNLEFKFTFIAFLIFYLLHAYLSAVMLNKLSGKK